MQLPVTADVDKVNDRVFQLALCDGDYANIIVDLAYDEQIDPEIRVYPSSHPTDAEERVVLPLPGYEPADDAVPVVREGSPEDENNSDKFSICLPYDGELVTMIRVETDGSVPYITVELPAEISRTGEGDPAYTGYVVHTRPAEHPSK